MIDEMMPSPHRLNRLKDAEPTQPQPLGGGRFEQCLRFTSALLIRDAWLPLRSTTTSASGFCGGVGHFVPAGIPVMMVVKGDRLSPEGNSELLAAFDFGPTRTLQQDVEFGVLQIVDIALKAISPAVNDPTTAICCVDQLSRILIRFASREPRRRNCSTILRASFAPPLDGSTSNACWTQPLTRSAFIRSRTWPSACDCCEPSVTSPSRRPMRSSAGHLSSAECGIVAGCAEKLGEEELREVRARLAALASFTTIS